MNCKILLSLILLMPSWAVAVDSDKIERFAYDSVGNILFNGAVYGQANRIVENDFFTFKHDADGNMVERVRKSDGDTVRYYWNSMNELVSVSRKEVIVDFKYDGLGRRIEKTAKYPDSRTVTRRYVYDGVDIVAILDETNQPVSIFLHGPGVDDPLEMICPKENKNYYFYTDGLGSIVAISDGDKVIERIEYTAFGIPFFVDVEKSTVSRQSKTPCPYAFTGREWDAEIGLYYYRARYYSPYLARFIQEDPIGFQGGDVNLYAYVHNNPVTHRDPYGTSPIGTDFLKMPQTSLSPKIRPQMYEITENIAYKIAFSHYYHYLYDPYHDYFQKPGWSFDIAYKFLQYPSFVPGFPMFMPLEPYEKFKKPIMCPVD